MGPSLGGGSSSCPRGHDTDEHVSNHEEDGDDDGNDNDGHGCSHGGVPPRTQPRRAGGPGVRGASRSVPGDQRGRAERRAPRARGAQASEAWRPRRRAGAPRRRGLHRRDRAGGALDLHRVARHRPAALCGQRGRGRLQPRHGASRRARAAPRRGVGSAGRHGDALGARQAGLAAQPARAQAPRAGRLPMTARYASVDMVALKERHPLGGVVEATGVRLRGRGRVRQGVCPFHEEAEGSFTVYADTDRWYCFGCGDGGDALDFLQRAEGLSLPEAIRRLDASPPTTAPVRRTASRQRRHRDAVAPHDPALLTAAARYYASELRRSGEARDYLASRGISLGTALRLGLGFASGQGLRAALASAGFAAGRVRVSGLFTERDERFARMVTVPEIAAGRVRWLAGRAIDPGRAPRFQAPPGPKPVLGMGRLGLAPSWAIVTEGVFDWLLLGEWGLPACCALGTQGMERVAAALRGCPRVFLAFDHDDAGHEATAALGSLLGRRAAAVTLPDGVADVAELATHHEGRGAFLRLLERAASAAR
ncbi:MAG: hypothetical protein F4194_07400 [Acidimicrobiia bacterium]|nr:hypothetical protein [Acidimicrobiia bacterium]MYK55494.1 hypothetical protein [Acidimicrobiia bacterium]